MVVTCTCELLGQREASDSGGQREKRWVIEIPMRLGDGEWPVGVTHTDRDSMLFRILVGRTAMFRRIPVGPQVSNHVGKRPDPRSPYPDPASVNRNYSKNDENRFPFAQSETLLHRTTCGGGDRARPRGAAPRQLCC